MTPDLVSVLVRSLEFVALFQAAGAVMFLLIHREELDDSRSGISRLARLSALCGLILVAAHQVLEAARMADDFSGVLDIGMQRFAWSSSAGVMHVLQIIALGVVAVALPRAGRSVVVVASSAAVLAFLLTGHTSTHPLRWLLAPLLAMHLLVVAFWFGALVPLVFVSRTESPANAARIVERFSALAGWLVPLILIAGLGMTWVLANGNLTLVHRPYGQLLVAKLALFAALMLFAACNKWRLTPSLSAGEAHAGRSLRRSIVAEYVLISAVLAVTAVLTSLFSPEM
jgi:putative copper export protein